MQYMMVEDTPPIAIPNRYNNIRCITGNQISSQLEYEMSISYDCPINRYIQKPNLVQRIVVNMMVMQLVVMMHDVAVDIFAELHHNNQDLVKYNARRKYYRFICIIFSNDIVISNFSC